MSNDLASAAPAWVGARVDGGAVRAISRLLAFVAVALLFFAPFLLPVHRSPLPSFDAEWLAAALLAVAAVFLGLSLRQRVDLQWPLPAWLIGMVALTAAHYMLGHLHYSSQLVLACVYGFAIIGAYFVGRALRAADALPRVLPLLAWTLVSGAALSVLVQWMQLFDVSVLPWWLYAQITDPWYRTRPFGNLAQANQLTTYLVWALVAVPFLLQRSLRPWVALLLTLFIAAGLALTRSRMGLLFAVGVVAIYWLPTALRPATFGVRARMTLALVLGYVAGTAAVILLISYQGAAVDTALTRFNEAGGVAIRAAMWRGALDVAASAPFLGVGFGEFAAHHYWLAQPDPALVPTPYVHNLVLQTAAELGWPMALALVGLGAWWFGARARQRLGEPDTALCWLLLCFVCAHAMLEWPLALLYFSLPTAILLAMAEPRLPRSRAGSGAFDGRLLAVAGMAGALLALPMKLEFDELADTMAKAEAGRSALKTIDEVTLGRIVALSDSARFRLLAELYLVTVRNPASVEATPEEIARHERLLTRGAEPPIIARLVILCAKAGRMDEALRHADRLNVFDTDRQTDFRGTVLDAIKQLGPEADALRAKLRKDAARTDTAPAAKEEPLSGKISR